jgi:hypothetical protein
MLGEWVPSRLTEFSIDASPKLQSNERRRKGSTAGSESPGAGQLSTADIKQRGCRAQFVVRLIADQ